jgi:16S rRNA C1402 N4-methylase RsmH
LPVTGRAATIGRLVGGAQRADTAEVRHNPRSRSATLRVVEKAA